MWNLSRLTHNTIFGDTDESLCSRAWRLQDEHDFWWIWTLIFGREHCRKSFRYYWGDRE